LVPTVQFICQLIKIAINASERKDSKKILTGPSESNNKKPLMKTIVAAGRYPSCLAPQCLKWKLTRAGI
jgi:hypothetical protein